MSTIEKIAEDAILAECPDLKVWVEAAEAVDAPVIIFRAHETSGEPEILTRFSVRLSPDKIPDPRQIRFAATHAGRSLAEARREVPA